MQGDIIPNCPVFRPPENLKWPPQQDEEEAEFTVGNQDIIIMSQSCDLEAQQKSDMWLVLLCPIWKLSEAESANAFLRSSYGKEECRKGHMHGYHMIAECSDERWRNEISIVSFREVLSLPLNFLRNFAQSLGSRPRMRSPYREHLAQSFARYFMRVGLPVNIPPFIGDKKEEEAIKILHRLEATQLARVLEIFK